MARRVPLALPLLLCVALLGRCAEPQATRPPGDEAAARAAAWLWAQQAEDGGWHSATYGLLGSGQALTPFVLEALLALPPQVAPRPRGGVGRALAFLRERTDADGALGLADPDIADYPCYATSLALRVLQQVDADEDAALRARMEGWLLSQQLGDALGWTPSDAVYGAWGIGGVPRRPPHAGHIDLSMTRHVLEALAPLDPRRAEVRACRRAARHFVERVRVRGDDPSDTRGFYFTPVLPEKNKAGPRAGGGYEPYGTTNADGLLALLAIGFAPRDPKVRGALAPLVAAHRVDRTPGPETLVTSGWAAATVFYSRAAAARVFARLGVEEAPAGRDWRAALVAVLVAEQADDGRFVGHDARMKEDDPLIATPLALRALAAARR